MTTPKTVILFIYSLFLFIKLSEECAAIPAPVPIPGPIPIPILIIDKKKKKCLHPDTELLLPNGKHKAVKLLQKGDMVLSFTQGKVQATELMSHEYLDENRIREYLEIVTERGNKFTVTPEHIVYGGKCGQKAWERYSSAKLSKGDCVPSLTIGKFVDDSVVSISSFHGNEGVYQSVTKAGNLIAGNVSISCYDDDKTMRKIGWIRKVYENFKTKYYDWNSEK